MSARTPSLINKGIVFVGLGLFIAVVYVAITSVTNAVLAVHPQLKVTLSILSVAVIAIAFQPVRGRLQRTADRLVYGRRATPYEAITELTRRVGSALAAEEVLPRAAEVAARSVGAPLGQATIYMADGQQMRSSWPSESDSRSAQATTAIEDRGEAIGAIAVAIAGSLSESQASVLNHLAVQAAPAFRNIRLTADLERRVHEVSVRNLEIQASKQRLVTAEGRARAQFRYEVERGPQRKLEETLDLLGAMESKPTNDSEAVGQTLVGMHASVSAALDELRELVRTLFPAILSERGIVPALQDEIRKLNIQAEVVVDPALSDIRFDPRIEGAIYYCGVVALRDASREPRADPFVLNLETSTGNLVLSTPMPIGTTKEDIADRVSALGGGVAVTSSSLVVAVPLRQLEVV